MLLFAAILSLLPPASDAFTRPICGGLTLPDGIVMDASGHATVRVAGCGTRVIVACDAPFTATLPRTFLADGDTFTVEGAVPYTGRESCHVVTAQGRTSAMISEP